MTYSYSFWDVECERLTLVLMGHFFPFYPPPFPPIPPKKTGGGGEGGISCPVTSLTIWKIILKKWKKHLEISLFNTCEPKITIIWCMLPEVWSATDNFHHFGPFFALLPNYWHQKLKFGKNVQKRRGYYPLTHV